MTLGLIDETLPTCRTDYIRYVTRGFGTGEQRWLGDVQMSLTLVNRAHLCQGLRLRRLWTVVRSPGSEQLRERGA